MKNGNGKITAEERRQAKKSLSVLRQAVGQNGGAVLVKNEKSDSYAQLPQKAVEALMDNLEDLADIDNTVADAESLMSTAEVAKFLDITEDHVFRAMSIPDGELPYQKKNGEYKILRRDALRYGEIRKDQDKFLTELVRLSEDMGLYNE